MTRHNVLGLDPAAYPRHLLHADERLWVEKNCYIDVWIELIHALGLDPMAMLGFTLAIDFEDDQWTFFKPPHDELRDLYGVDVQELNVWLPLLEHAERQLGAGKLVSTEADAFFLPDTSGTDYRRQHTKTTIIVADLDAEARRLGYFHNAGYFALEGEDFAGLFRLAPAPEPTVLPLFAELVRTDRVVRRDAAELRQRSLALLRRHLARRPSANPVRRFGEAFEGELPGLQARGIDHYHAWAFATVRQLGAASELAALHLRWLGERGDAALAGAGDELEAVSSAAKTFILKAARAVNARRPLDARASFGEMAGAWERAMDLLERAVAPAGGHVPADGPTLVGPQGAR